MSWRRFWSRWRSPRTLTGQRLLQRESPSVLSPSDLDRTLRAAVQSIPVPPDLLSSILAEHRVVQEPSPWWARSVSYPWMAAALILLAVGIGSWASWSGLNGRVEDDPFIESAWGRSPHMDHAATNLLQVKEWLSGQQAYANFKLPPALEQLSLRGCGTVPWRGGRAAVLCFLQDGQHLHLVVTGLDESASLPESGSPEFARYGSLYWIAWRQGTSTFRLTGMTSSKFVKRFRKAGQWTISG